MPEKIAKLHLERDKDVMMFIKNGDVWGMPRHKPGVRRGKVFLIAEVGIEMDFSRYLYFVDVDGDIARHERQVPVDEPKNAGPRKKKKKATKKTATKKAKAAKKTKAAAPSRRRSAR